MEKWETRRTDNAARHEAVIQEHKARIAAVPAQVSDLVAKSETALVDLNRVSSASKEELPSLPSQPNDTYMEELGRRQPSRHVLERNGK